jgi:transcriptional regulator with AAA-type ATPase domain
MLRGEERVPSLMKPPDHPTPVRSRRFLIGGRGLQPLLGAPRPGLSHGQYHWGMPDDLTRTFSPLSPDNTTPTAVLVLFVVHHPDPRFLGTRVPVTRALTLGRGADALGRGVLDVESISRQHTRIQAVRGRLEVTDLDSRNGTWVDGARAERVSTGDGALILLGEVMLLVCSGPPTPPPRPTSPVVGVSDAMARALTLLGQAATRRTTVLLLGETGVGKEVFAAELHRLSQRSGSFVPFNCGGLAPDLLQSELFGHARGAFSGASAARKGLVETAEGGTLFIDEIGEAPRGVQVLLLRLLQESEIRPVGTSRPRKIDVRFVAATNQDLSAQVEAGGFRRDLLARLSRWVVPIPPLRERRADIPLLARHFIRQHAGRDIPLSVGLSMRLLQHPWPGNVRELDGLVERLVVSEAGSDHLHGTHWPAAPAAPPPSPVRPVRPEPARLRALLGEHSGNIKALSQSLGVSRQSLYKWLREAGIQPDEARR